MFYKRSVWQVSVYYLMVRLETFFKIIYLSIIVITLLYMLQFHENSSFHSKICIPFFWDKNDILIMVLQLYDDIINLNAKQCTQPPKNTIPRRWLLKALAEEFACSFLSLEALKIPFRDRIHIYRPKCLDIGHARQHKIRQIY